MIIIKYEATARAVFCRYSDGTSKLFCVAEFQDKESAYDGYSYDTALENAELIAEVMNKTIVSQQAQA